MEEASEAAKSTDWRRKQGPSEENGMRNLSFSNGKNTGSVPGLEAAPSTARSMQVHTLLLPLPTHKAGTEPTAPPCLIGFGHQERKSHD